MSAPPSAGGAPIESRRQLVDYFAAGNKPAADWRIGTEHEKFGFDTTTLKPCPSMDKSASVPCLRA
jgi:glutamate--cysteine ligase